MSAHFGRVVKPTSWKRAGASHIFTLACQTDFADSRLWGKLCCLGLDRDEIEGNTRRVKRFQELRLEGVPRSR